MFFNFVFMFLWFYPPSAKTETKDTYKIPCRLYVNRGHFYFGQRGHPDFGFRGQINLAPGVIRAWVFQYEPRLFTGEFNQSLKRIPVILPCGLHDGVQGGI